MSESNRRIVLARRPAGIPAPSDFRRDDVSLGARPAGTLRIRNRFLSVDPAMRGWVNAAANYSKPVGIGEVMRSLCVGVVEASDDPAHPVGQALYGWFGWQDWCDALPSQVIARVDPEHGPLSSGLGIYGITGITAFLALHEIGRPQAGETVLVSTAAGAVGSIVGQLAREAGARVVGITGSDEKVARCVAEFGYHAAISYRQGYSVEALRALVPDGVDVFFDNTSGPIADIAWEVLRERARIVQCGTASVAHWDPPPMAPRRERQVLVRRLRHEGFIVFDHVARFEWAIAQLAARVARGALRYREDIHEGLDAAPEALAGLYRGDNQGKQVIRL